MLTFLSYNEFQPGTSYMVEMLYVPGDDTDTEGQINSEGHRLKIALQYTSAYKMMCVRNNLSVKAFDISVVT